MTSFSFSYFCFVGNNDWLVATSNKQLLDKRTFCDKLIGYLLVFRMTSFLHLLVLLFFFFDTASDGF